jgi:hypothetical protein
MNPLSELWNFPDLISVCEADAIDFAMLVKHRQTPVSPVVGIKQI